MTESLTNELAEIEVVDIDGNIVPRIGALIDSKRAILFVNVATK